MSRRKLYHKQRVPALFKKKNDRDWGGQKDTESEGVVSEEAVELVVKDVKWGGGIKNIQVEARETTLFGATKNSAANGSRG